MNMSRHAIDSPVGVFLKAATGRAGSHVRR